MADLKEMMEKVSLSENSIISEKRGEETSKKEKNSSKRRTWLENIAIEEVCEMPPEDIRNWSFHDRPQAELGDIQLLSK